MEKYSLLINEDGITRLFLFKPQVCAIINLSKKMLGLIKFDQRIFFI